jgi:class 3 adenylate cyclase
LTNPGCTTIKRLVFPGLPPLEPGDAGVEPRAHATETANARMRTGTKLRGCRGVCMSPLTGTCLGRFPRQALRSFSPKPPPIPGLREADRTREDDTSVVEPRIRYARNGDLYIAYVVIGEAPLDLLYVTSYESTPTLDSWRSEPVVRRWVERLASFSRLILMDVRGTGLSDRITGAATLEDGVDDMLAVLDAVGSERTGILGFTHNAALVAMFTAGHPDRVSGLVLYGAVAPNPTLRFDATWGWTDSQFEAVIDEILARTGQGVDLDQTAPSLAQNTRFREWWIRKQVTFASPGGVRAAFMMMQETDARPVFPTIRVPTLVLHRVDDQWSPVENSRYIAGQIPGARLVELPGNDGPAYAGDAEALAGEIEEFFTGIRRPTDADRVLATLLFTDIVGSTEKAAEMGDAPWKRVLAEHDERARLELERHRGRWINTTGDGLLATFDGPARAVRCAEAIRAAMHELGIEVRAGCHTGEVELVGTDVRGIAVHLAARVASLAEPGEVLVSSTVKDLVAGSGLVFHDRGMHRLKGVPDDWRLFALA